MYVLASLTVGLEEVSFENLFCHFTLLIDHSHFKDLLKHYECHDLKIQVFIVRTTSVTLNKTQYYSSDDYATQRQ
jgi:hypothetical protein